MVGTAPGVKTCMQGECNACHATRAATPEVVGVAERLRLRVGDNVTPTVGAASGNVTLAETVPVLLPVGVPAERRKRAHLTGR